MAFKISLPEKDDKIEHKCFMETFLLLLKNRAQRLKTKQESSESSSTVLNCVKSD